MKKSVLLLCLSLFFVQCSGDNNTTTDHSTPSKTHSATGNGPAVMNTPLEEASTEVLPVVYSCENTTTNTFKPCVDQDSRHFGSDIDVDGSWMIVGARQENNYQGAVYFFHKNEAGAWAQTQIVSGTNAQSWFGSSVAISGNIAVVGAYKQAGSNASDSEAGAAYVFEKNASNQWVQTAMIVGANANNRLGYAVDASNDTVVIGAYKENNQSLVRSGAVYTFAKSNGLWTQTAKIAQSNAAANDYFGSSLSLRGDQLIVGAVAKDTNSSDSSYYQGSAYIFNRSGSTWNQATQLLASNPNANEMFGWDVDIQGTRAVVGAPGKTATGTVNGYTIGLPNAGGVYVYELVGTTWQQSSVQFASNAGSYELMGKSVSLDGNTLVAGSYQENSAGDINPTTNSWVNSGATYVFQASGSTWTQSQILKSLNMMNQAHFGYAVLVSGNEVFSTAAIETTGAKSHAGVGYVLNVNNNL